MENRKSPVRSWNNMNYNILLKIFMALNVVDLTTVSLVCRSWRKACKDPVFWDGKVFDLSDCLYSAANLSIESNNDHSSGQPSDSKLTQFLKCALDLSCGQLSCFVFSFLQSISDEDLLLVAERTANLKRLVLPRWNIQLTKKGVHQAMKLWRGLQSLTIADISMAYDIVEAIGKHCNNFSELKVSCDFGTEFAEALIKHVPKLKILSLQSTLVSKDALVLVANHLEHLEILNVSHSFVVGLTDVGTNLTIYTQHEVAMIVENNMSGISTLIGCEGLCGMCLKVLEWNITNEDEWKNPKEEVWRDDEIPTLSILK